MISNESNFIKKEGCDASLNPNYRTIFKLELNMNYVFANYCYSHCTCMARVQENTD